MKYIAIGYFLLLLSNVTFDNYTYLSYIFAGVSVYFFCKGLQWALTALANSQDTKW